MGGPPAAPEIVAPPPAPVAEESPIVAEAKAKEETRLASRRAFKSTIKSKSGQDGELASAPAQLLKTTLGS